jgi:hypothetical protein
MRENIRKHKRVYIRGSRAPEHSFTYTDESFYLELTCEKQFDETHDPIHLPLDKQEYNRIVLSKLPKEVLQNEVLNFTRSDLTISGSDIKYYLDEIFTRNNMKEVKEFLDAAPNDVIDVLIGYFTSAFSAYAMFADINNFHKSFPDSADDIRLFLFQRLYFNMKDTVKKDENKYLQSIGINIVTFHFQDLMKMLKNLLEYDKSNVSRHTSIATEIKHNLLLTQFVDYYYALPEYLMNNVSHDLLKQLLERIQPKSHLAKVLSVAVNDDYMSKMIDQVQSISGNHYVYDKGALNSSMPSSNDFDIFIKAKYCTGLDRENHQVYKFVGSENTKANKLHTSKLLNAFLFGGSDLKGRLGFEVWTGTTIINEMSLNSNIKGEVLENLLTILRQCNNNQSKSPTAGGGRFKYKGRFYKVRDGPRGGKYIIVQGKKKRIAFTSLKK